jgi:hypothetical protein
MAGAGRSGSSAAAAPLTMSHQPAKESFVARHLDPASRLGEILFGLIMVLTVTLTAGLTADSGKSGARQLLHAAIGCNIAWGIIDAVMYVMNCMTVRSGRWRLLRAVQGAPNPEAALDLVRQTVESELSSLSGPEEREALYRSIFQHLAHAQPRKTRITKEDLCGAVACFWLVFISCLPATMPFLVFSNPTCALRVSNLLLIAMLFLIGQKWAQYANTNRLLAGLAMVGVGLSLVGVAVLLGG